MAPEILKSEEYNETLDIWCLGIITYELLFARSPFEKLAKDNGEKMLDRIVSMNFTFDHSDIIISENAKDFISKVFPKL